MGLHGNSSPPGYRRLTHRDVMDVGLRTRLVVEHQARGGWGLVNDPLHFNYQLVVAEGWLLVNGKKIHLSGSNAGLIPAKGLYRAGTALDFMTQEPWITAPPAPDAAWTVDPKWPPIPSSPCLMMRVAAPVSTSGAVLCFGGTCCDFVASFLMFFRF